MGFIKKFLKRFELEGAAAAFAEVGEIEIAKELLEEAKREVLFGIYGNKIDTKVINCVKSLCKRIEAGLDILYVSNSVKICGRVKNYINSLLKDLEKEARAKKN